MVGNRVDVLEEFRKQLERADVVLLREMVKVFAEQLGGRCRRAARRGLWRALRSGSTGRNGYRERPLGNPRRHNRASGAEASLGHVLPRVAAGATSASRASVRAGRRGVLRAWGVQTDASRDSLLSSGSSGSPAHASRRWPRSSTAPSRRSAPDRSTLAPTHVLPDALTQKVREAGRIVSVAALMALPPLSSASQPACSRLAIKSWP